MGGEYSGRCRNSGDTLIQLAKCLIASMLLLLFVWAAVGQASAEVFVYGSNQNYSEVVLPNNSYVHQGENISQGYCYDLSGVYGWTGILGHWDNENYIGYRAPSDYIDLNVGNPRNTCLDTPSWKVGDWYQIDSAIGDSDAFKSSHGNNYVFHVVRKQEVNDTVVKVVEDKVVILNTTVYQFNGTENVAIPVTIEIPVTSHVEIVPVEQPSDVVTIVVATTAAVPVQSDVKPPTVVTRKADISWILAFIALAGVVLCRRH